MAGWWSGGCGPEAPTWQAGLEGYDGEFVAVYNSKDLSFCAGTREHLDGLVPFVAGELGVAAPGGLTYAWLDEEGLASSPCVEESFGCSVAGGVFSGMPAHLHELVHLVAEPNRLNPTRFFAEGLAVAYDYASGDVATRQVVFGGLWKDPRPLFLKEALEPSDYLRAGWFVTFLLAHHGPERYVSFVRAIADARDLATIERRFLETFKIELEGEVERWLAGTCPDLSFPVRPYDCAAPPVAWDEGAWRFQQSLACEAEGVVGGIDEARPRPKLRSVTLEVPARGSYVIEAQAGVGVKVQLEPCFGCPWQPRGAVLTGTDARQVELEAGLYFIKIRAEAASTASVVVALAPE